MKNFVASILFLIPIITYSQVGVGKYRLCFEMYWKCHTQIFLNLNEDSTYSFTLIDDTNSETTTGTWYLIDSKVFLRPSTIPDSIQTELFETKLSKSVKEYWWNESNKTIKQDDDNLLVIYKNFDRYLNKKIEYYQSDIKHVIDTDSLGCVFYPGKPLDSLSISIGHRLFTIKPKEKEKPSFLRLTFRTKYKDLIYRILETDFIQIEKNRMYLVETLRNKEKKKVYFEKIE